jgi:hypothetical protein
VKKASNPKEEKEEEEKKPKEGRVYSAWLKTPGKLDVSLFGVHLCTDIVTIGQILYCG